MVDLPYSGAATRAAHFATANDVAPGISKDHTTGATEPDPFNPQPDVPADQAGTVWGTDPANPGQSNQPNLAQVPVNHWFDGQAAVPSGEEYARAQLAMQERMMWDHSQTNYVPDSVRLYQHFSEGQENDFIIGRLPVAAGATIPDGPLAGLQNGRNSYDAINQPNEVYSGDAANVGRYRLGVKTNVFGVYSNPIGKFGQDALLHAYTGLTPQFPNAKAPMTDTAPYTPNSTGTTTWAPAVSQQDPSLFALPSETQMTDFTIGQEAATSSEFVDRGGF
jgi:hypothetical protein